MLLRTSSFDGGFSSKEQSLMNKSVLRYKIYSIGIPSRYRQFIITVPVSKIKVQGIEPRKNNLTEEQIYIELDSMHDYISNLRIEKDYFTKYKNYKSKNLKYINNYYGNYIDDVWFEFFVNKNSKVVAINTTYDGKRDSYFYFRNDTLIYNLRRRMTVDGTSMIGMEQHISWKTETSSCSYSGNRMIRANNKGLSDYQDQRLKAGYFYKGIAEYLINHDSINCSYRDAKYNGTDSQFKASFFSLFDKEIMSELFEYKKPLVTSAHIKFDSTGNITDISVKNSPRWNASSSDSLLYRNVKNEMERILLLMEWETAKFNCKPIGSEKKIRFNYNIGNKNWQEVNGIIYWQGL